jgi:hypothetical protein
MLAIIPQALVSLKKYMAPSSSLLQGKHLPFSHFPLRFDIFRLFVILSLTQLYRYTPEIFLFSSATFKYTYRGLTLGKIRVKVVELWLALDRVSVKVVGLWLALGKVRRMVYFSVIETDTATSDLRWIFHMHSEIL